MSINERMTRFDSGLRAFEITHLPVEALAHFMQHLGTAISSSSTLEVDNGQYWPPAPRDITVSYANIDALAELDVTVRGEDQFGVAQSESFQFAPGVPTTTHERSSKVWGKVYGVTVDRVNGNISAADVFSVGLGIDDGSLNQEDVKWGLPMRCRGKDDVRGVRVMKVDSVELFSVAPRSAFTFDPETNSVSLVAGSAPAAGSANVILVNGVSTVGRPQ